MSRYRAAAIRAIRTLAQVALSAIGASTVFDEIDVRYVLTISILSAVVSFCHGLLGLPETEDK